MEKAKYSIFHKPNKKDNIPLVLPKLNINNIEIARTESIKFFGVFVRRKPKLENTYKIHRKQDFNKYWYIT